MRNHSVRPLLELLPVWRPADGAQQNSGKKKQIKERAPNGRPPIIYLVNVKANADFSQFLHQVRMAATHRKAIGDPAVIPRYCRVHRCGERGKAVCMLRAGGLFTP